MATELAKTYSPAEVEPEIARRWDAARAFHAEPSDSGKPFSIVIPPPNVTAALHMGHALNNALQDILTRWHRMLGDNTLWMPGTDHAGIATQTVVEKRVLAEEGKKRTDFSREEFVKKIQAWKDEYEATILGQLKAMGCSCDWERTRFTMDDICARAVREAFFRLFKDGLIYRGKRLVNWDPATQTALADDEVEMEEIDGHFYYLRYPLEKAQGLQSLGALDYVTVATTRPETMLGDTAVAINPKDPRTPQLRGKKVRLPIVNRVVPIIEDEYVVLPDPNGDEKARYSSGFLKVTPAHDPNDYELGQKHHLPMINVMAPDASISLDHGWSATEPHQKDNPDLQPLAGLAREQARKAVVQWFKDHDLLEEIKPYRHSVGHSYRSHVPIEPYLSDQWYVKVTDDRLAGAALRAMAPDQRSSNDGAPSRQGGAPSSNTALSAPNTAQHRPAGTVLRDNQAWQGQLRFTPARYAKTFEQWHTNIRDWCISRQLWWGHRIPVWTLRSLDLPGTHGNFELSKKMTRWNREERLEAIWWVMPDGSLKPLHICVRNERDTEIIQAFESVGYVQDPDVLDTWFSSGLWPLSTMGWPDETDVLKTWNPTDVLCTAREIITLWVGRMVMFNLYFRGQLPFRDVFIHAMIQDGEGRKMSKSLGNGVDPLDIIHSHGADAMRFALAAMTTNTQDVRMPVARDPQTGRNTSEKFDYGRNFANKLWNAARFALSKLEGAKAHGLPLGLSARDRRPSVGLTLADRWILSRLAATVRDTNAALKNFEFSQYAQGLYDFFWRDFCDWYIEAVKPTVAENPAQQQVLAACLDASLRLLHPSMPFITEKLWERLNEVVPQRGIKGVTLPAAPLLVKAPWPVVDESLIDADAEASFGLARDLIVAIRTVRAEHKIAPRQTIELSAKAPTALVEKLRAQTPLIETLANVKVQKIAPDLERPADAASALVGQAEVYLHGLIDADAERTRLTKRLEELDRSVKTLTGRLANKSYVDKAPAHLVQQTQQQLADTEREVEALRKQLAELN